MSPWRSSSRPIQLWYPGFYVLVPDESFFRVVVCRLAAMGRYSVESDRSLRSHSHRSNCSITNVQLTLGAVKVFEENILICHGNENISIICEQNVRFAPKAPVDTSREANFAVGNLTVIVGRLHSVRSIKPFV